MPLDPQAKKVLEAAALLGAPDLATLTPEEARAAQLETTQRAGPAEDIESVDDRTISGPHGPIPVRVYRPTSGTLPALVYFHGGGWVVGSLDVVDVPMRALSNRSGWAIVSVDYRKAPEHKFPIPVDDARAAIDWVRAAGSELEIDPARVAVGGDSAGGNLAAAAALLLRTEGLPLAAQILIYPITDFSFDTPSYEEFAEGYGLARDEMGWFWNHYLPDESAGATELASPLRAENLDGLPPALVITAEYDVLRDEGEALARRLRAAGIEVRLSRYEGMIHGFFRMGAVIDAAHRAVDEVAAYLRSMVHSSDADGAEAREPL